MVPLETAFGRKRAINQDACNKDFSCVEGFCPSFVTVHGAEPRRGRRPELEASLAPVPEPELPEVGSGYSILIAGIGGTGVVTVSNLLGMAAHLEHRGVSVLDQTGLAQKFGAVSSHVRIVPRPGSTHSVRIPAGMADVLLGCDIAVAASGESLAGVDAAASAAVVNTHQDMPAEFIRDRDLRFPEASLRQTLAGAVREGGAHFVDATRLARRLLGDTTATNVLLLGFAWQQGLVPLSRQALQRAIELNGVAVEMNLQAFEWGRRAAADPRALEQVLDEARGREAPPRTLDELIDHRARFLGDYQDRRYAERYRDTVRRAADGEAAVSGEPGPLAEAVARSLSQLMAIKDEYEVARLYTDGRFAARLAEEFEGGARLEFHLAPPLLSRPDPATGRPRKRRFGGWMLWVFRGLAPLRRIRGTFVDPFGWTAERRMEREILRAYEARLERMLPRLTPGNLALATELLALPQEIRGFGPVKAQAVARISAREAELEARFAANGGSPAGGGHERTAA